MCNVLSYTHTHTHTNIYTLFPKFIKLTIIALNHLSIFEVVLQKTMMHSDKILKDGRKGERSKHKQNGQFGLFHNFS